MIKFNNNIVKILLLKIAINLCTVRSASPTRRRWFKPAYKATSLGAFKPWISLAGQSVYNNGTINYTCASIWQIIINYNDDNNNNTDKGDGRI